VKHSATLRTKRGFRQFVLGFIGIVAAFLDQAIVPDRSKTCEIGFHFALLESNKNGSAETILNHAENSTTQ
jgi:hypothetical protein